MASTKARRWAYAGRVRTGGMVSPMRSGPDLHLAFADGALLAHFGPPSRLAGFLVMFALAQLLGDAAPLEQFFEAAQRRPDRFAVVDAHSQSHASSFRISPAGGLGRRLGFSTPKTRDAA